MKCASWPSNDRKDQCPYRAVGWLVAPDGGRVPGGVYCQMHLDRDIEEYQTKLGETWTIDPLTPQEQHLP